MKKEQKALHEDHIRLSARLTIRPSVCPSVRLSGSSDWIVCRIFMKFRVVGLYTKLSTKHDFRKNRRSGRHTWSKRVNESVAAVSIFLDRFGLNSAYTICMWCCSAIMSSWKYFTLGCKRNFAHFLYFLPELHIRVIRIRRKWNVLKSLFSSCEFHKNRSSEIHALLKGVTEYLPVRATFFRFECNLFWWRRT